LVVRKQEDVGKVELVPVGADREWSGEAFDEGIIVGCEGPERPGNEDVGRTARTGVEAGVGLDGEPQPGGAGRDRGDPLEERGGEMGVFLAACVAEQGDAEAIAGRVGRGGSGAVSRTPSTGYGSIEIPSAPTCDHSAASSPVGAWKRSRWGAARRIASSRHRPTRAIRLVAMSGSAGGGGRSGE